MSDELEDKRKNDPAEVTVEEDQNGNNNAKIQLAVAPERLSGSTSKEFCTRILTQSINSILGGVGLANKDVEEVMQMTLATLQGIRPRDEIEGQLAAQMVASHNASMDLYRRAFIHGQPIEVVEIYLKQAAKLSRLYTEQMAALKKYRGESGNQTVTVKHQHIEVNSSGPTQVNAFPPGGVEEKIKEQPHAKQVADASQSSLRCQDTLGEAVPVARDQGKEALSNARGKRKRST